MTEPMSEGYPEEWRHATIHLNTKTGVMHSDGDHSVREWIENEIRRSREERNQADDLRALLWILFLVTMATVVVMFSLS